MKLFGLTSGRGLLSRRYALVAAAAVLVMYIAGSEWYSYFSTMSRMVSQEVGDRIPIQFEIERARTMIEDLIPDVKRNMVIIAEEEIGVTNLREDLDQTRAQLDDARGEILKLRNDSENQSGTVRNGDRLATPDEIRDELQRRFARYQMAEATFQAKQQLLTSRENSLAAARARLDRMLNAKRDLEVEVENLEARLHNIHSESAATRVQFDDTQLARCEKLVGNLRVRLQVAEHLIASQGELDSMPTTVRLLDEDILGQIDSHFSKTDEASLAKND